MNVATRLLPEDLRVAGITNYVQEMDEIDGFLVELVREPDNPYDSHAIAIYLLRPGGRMKVGYVPRDITGTIPLDRLPLQAPIVERGTGKMRMLRVRV
jgi:hypothetical protein